MKEISTFDCKVKLKNTKTHAKTSLVHHKRAKNAKTDLQILTLKYFHDVFYSNMDNTSLITQICDYTGFSRRQVYKWFWDENSRRRNRSQIINEEISERIREAYNEVFGLLKTNVFGARGMVLRGIYIPENKMLNAENNRAVMNLKLAGLGSDTIFMKMRGN